MFIHSFIDGLSFLFCLFTISIYKKKVFNYNFFYYENHFHNLVMLITSIRTSIVIISEVPCGITWDDWMKKQKKKHNLIAIIRQSRIPYSTFNSFRDARSSHIKTRRIMIISKEHSIAHHTIEIKKQHTTRKKAIRGRNKFGFKKKKTSWVFFLWMKVCLEICREKLKCGIRNIKWM